MLDTHTAIEIEAKMRLDDAAALQSRLQVLDAERGPVRMEINTYFDTPQHRLRAGDQGLRIRSATDLHTGREEVIITHKGPRAHGRLKSRSETEVIVDDDRSAAQLLLSLGYQPVMTFEKKRERWELDDCHVEIDTLPYIGQFVEIEGPSDEAIFAVRDSLGLGPCPIVHASYVSLLNSYLTEHRITETHIKFEVHPVG